MSKHIAVAGNIGSGKTTLTEMLARHYGWEPHFEEVDHNPYLNDFYEDMQRWSFNLQIYFLNSRYRQNQEMAAKAHPTVGPDDLRRRAYFCAQSACHGADEYPGL